MSPLLPVSHCRAMITTPEGEKRIDGLNYTNHELWCLGGTATEGGSDKFIRPLNRLWQQTPMCSAKHKPRSNPSGEQNAHRAGPTARPPRTSPNAARRNPRLASGQILPLGSRTRWSEDEWIDGMFSPKGRGRRRQYIIRGACTRTLNASLDPTSSIRTTTRA